MDLNSPVSCIRLTIPNDSRTPRFNVGKYDLDPDSEFVTVAIAAVRANDVPPECPSVVDASLKNYEKYVSRFVSATVYSTPVSPIRR